MLELRTKRWHKVKILTKIESQDIVISRKFLYTNKILKIFGFIFRSDRIGKTRIHLDRVEGLGDFLELEVVLAEGEDPDVAKVEADSLLERLGISHEQFVEGAYIDLFHS